MQHCYLSLLDFMLASPNAYKDDEVTVATTPDCWSSLTMKCFTLKREVLPQNVSHLDKYQSKRDTETPKFEFVG